MTKIEALKFVGEHYPYTSGLDEGTALFRLRHRTICLPEYGVNGVRRDDAEWCYIDAWGKIDTGMYGDIYYFSDKEW